MKTDEQIITEAKAYLAAEKMPSKGGMCRKIGVGIDRLKAIAAQGHFELPMKMSQSRSATKRRLIKRPYEGWYISKPPVWMEKNAA